MRHPYGDARELKQPEFAKIPRGVICGRSPDGPCTGCLRFLNLYGDRKLIMHALIRRRAGLAPTPWVDVRFLYKTVREQPGNSPYGDRECAVTGALMGIPALWLAGDNPSANIKPSKKLWALEDMGLESFYTTVCIIGLNPMHGWRSFMCKEFMHGVNYASYICKDIRYSDLYFLKKPLKCHFIKITHWACATKTAL